MLTSYQTFRLRKVEGHSINLALVGIRQTPYFNSWTPLNCALFSLKQEERVCNADTGIPATQDLIDDAVAAGWSEEETANAIKIVSAGMYRGLTGTDPDE